MRIPGFALLLLLLTLAWTAPCHPPAQEGGGGLETLRVTWVYDGDTVLAQRGNGKQERLRLLGIDAPEYRQPWSARARERLRQLTLGKTLQARLVERDPYGRWLALLLDPAGQEINLQLVGEGLAWHYRHYHPDPRYARAEKEARRARRGLWQDKAPTPPWTWRRSHPRSAGFQNHQPPRASLTAGGLPSPAAPPPFFSGYWS